MSPTKAPRPRNTPTSNTSLRQSAPPTTTRPTMIPQTSLLHLHFRHNRKHHNANHRQCTTPLHQRSPLHHNYTKPRHLDRHQHTHRPRQRQHTRSITTQRLATHPSQHQSQHPTQTLPPCPQHHQITNIRHHQQRGGAHTKGPLRLTATNTQHKHTGKHLSLIHI